MSAFCIAIIKITAKRKMHLILINMQRYKIILYLNVLSCFTVEIKNDKFVNACRDYYCSYLFHAFITICVRLEQLNVILLYKVPEKYHIFYPKHIYINI